MAESLRETLLSDENKDEFVADARTVLDAEVKSKRGPTGMVIKGAYKTVNAVHASFVNSVIRVLLPDFLASLQPHWDDFAASGNDDFAAFLSDRGDEAANSLLEVVDRRAEGSSYRSVVKLYGQLRGQAHKHVVAAVPAVGRLIQGSMATS
ncbi:hypothetical protein IEU95_13695 [Hoyosella rhizosphaerae]|uniref:Uncharacterized protein n=1 Tax=Hoyosella rhizosphaerae TaxID=1755582 RepID=A0A916XGQ9_9ACTN|nr:hypothetical protein [Hoyosella rhizosphaerae]MBN4927893.1 hypothetical protein [Hoyosella rhizosphaerae]GGC70794.1 hypothetical protein GCM10011410_24590 [Hoyosella rhizosphaerae]